MKIKSYILFSITALFVCGCEGFLTENPETMPSESSVYNTEESLESSVRGIIGSFSGGSMYTHDMQEYMQTASCLVFFPMGSTGTYNSNERYYSSYRYAQSPTTALNNEMYANHYVGISRCNKLIEGLDSSPVDAEYKKEIEAEARFYRAVLYFGLVRFYGNVPLVTQMPKTANDADSPRRHYAEIYKFILEDLSYAYQNMREADKAEAVDPGGSRPCRWAAKAFMAAVYAQIGSYLSAPQDHAFGTQKTGTLEVDFGLCDVSSAKDAWKKAYAAATDVIENGPYELSSSYSDLFRWTEPGDWKLKERIFVLPSTNDGGSGQQLARRSLPPYPEGTANTITSNTNYGRFRPTRFVFQKWCETYGGEKGTGDNNSGIYVGCDDPRFDATFIHTSTTNAKTGNKYDLYPANNYVRSASRQYYAPYFKKYLSPAYNANAGNADFYFMRFAEMYLIAAEAAAELCSDPLDDYGQKAFSHIETLHQRARGELSGKAVSEQPKWESDRFATKAELINAIMWERVFEMYGEGHEWFDTHRRGNVWFKDNIVAPANEFLQREEETEARTWYGDSFLFNEDLEEIRKGLLNAFPENELIYNTALDYSDQNIYIWK